MRWLLVPRRPAEKVGSSAWRRKHIEQSEQGAHAATPGWFVVNLADARWMRIAEGGESVHVEPPGSSSTTESASTSSSRASRTGSTTPTCRRLLVLSGECILVVEEEERHLKAWDFFHCAPGTHHILVGAGDGPCAILMVGLRGEGRKLHYPVSEAAARYGASTPEKTDSPRIAYSDWSREFEPVRANWPL